MICDAINLGDFDHCEDVILEVIETEVTVKNVVTHWQCTYEDGTIGILAEGDYIAETADEMYKFTVI